MPEALLVFRPLNLIILAATQWLIYYCLGQGNHSIWLILALSSASILIAAAGNLLNDYFDRSRDLINKPGRNYSEFWKVNRLVWPVYAILNLSAIYLGSLLNTWLVLILLFTIVVLFLYNYSWKDLPVIGNLSISFLTALSVLLVRILDREINPSLLLYYAMFAMFLTWAREMIKDMEDQTGDEIVGARNLSIRMGQKNSLFFVRILVVFILALLFTAWPAIKNQIPLNVQLTALVYGLTCICLPLLAIITISYHSVQNFSLMSNLSKYAMVTGVLSLLFF